MFQIIILLFWLTTAESAAKYPLAKPGCEERCGNIDIPYPFGIGPNCYADGFAVTCNYSFKPHKPFIDSTNLEVLHILLNESTVQVNNPVITYNCSGRADSQDVDLRATPFSFSDMYNRFTASACNNLALITDGLTIVTGCQSICNVESSNETGSCGINCCQAKIPPLIRFINASLRSLDPKSNQDDCKYAFMVDYRWFSNKDIFNVRDMEFVPAVLDWVYNGTSCDMNEISCDNTFYCSEVGCFCSSGYDGNPYLSGGCRDIDECSDPRLNRCEVFCSNNPGSYTCSCPDGFRSLYIFNGTERWNTCWPKRPNGNSRTKAIIASTFSSLGAILLLICMWWLYREVNRRKEAKLKEKFFKRNGGLLLQQQLSSDQGNLETTQLFTSKELEKATDNYNANRILGQGGQGTVYKGMLTDGRIVAIKKSKALDEGNHEQFINEVVILSRINIRNVVKLFGCCLETEVPLLVYEFIPNGTLFQCIHDQNEEFPLTWDLRLRIATEIAGALFYLHSLASIAIYHRDIKSANILLDEKFRAKVSDFGISRSISVDKTHLTTAVQGTFGYLDPEYFQSNQFTDKSDVYSFGVVLVELLTGKRPILSSKSNEGGSLTAYFLLTMKENRLFDILDARVVKEGGKEEILAFANIAKRCLYLNGSSRPTMKEVVMELDGIRMSNGATATVKQSCDNVEYATEDDLSGPQEAASTSTVSFYHAMDIEPLALLLDKSSSSLQLNEPYCFVHLQQQQLSSDHSNFETTKLFTLKELEKATDTYNANRILGQGGQGIVYKGMLTDGRIVEKSKVLDEGKLEQFINEVVILTQINHRNDVKIFGWCLETEVHMLVYEFIPNGTLFEYIHDQNEEFPLTWDLRLQIATEIAGALSYLHSAASIAVYHRDIKFTNILLDDKFRAKVSDFGISRSISVDKTHLTTAVQGTFDYLDPEYFQSSQFTEKSDDYSFGVVLVQLLTGKRPILSAKSDEGGSLTTYFLLTMKENLLFDILDARVVKEEILVVVHVTKRCLSLNGRKRPTMKEVVMELDAIRMSNGASAAVKKSCEDVEYAVPYWTLGGCFYFNRFILFYYSSIYPTSVVRRILFPGKNIGDFPC
ncbi:hypothetical protein RHSIM_Rhsim07G0080800 [Rhododendron simsii]|uniref:Protein kinase domain-containing protein n=1 Tax=Rhododendron simsii TaxID=118357 RepID=A0A834GRX8_RHOSS|nr:hypothetical protein RHSIM_Rhsim07G0080800 [Rhododendron simsii]